MSSIGRSWLGDRLEQSESLGLHMGFVNIKKKIEASTLIKQDKICEASIMG